MGYICVWGLGPVYAWSLVGALMSAGSPGPRLVGSIGFLVTLLKPLGPSVLPVTLPQGSLYSLYSLHCPVFGCEAQWLFGSAAGWSLSEDSYARLLSASKAVSLLMSGLALSHGGGLRLVQGLVGHSLHLCFIFIPAHLVRKGKFWVELKGILL